MSDTCNLTIQFYSGSVFMLIRVTFNDNVQQAAVGQEGGWECVMLVIPYFSKASRFVAGFLLFRVIEKCTSDVSIHKGMTS